jgi:DNA-directed RNA polymerase sigma subunit (sigma70/sigma32)
MAIAAMVVAATAIAPTGYRVGVAEPDSFLRALSDLDTALDDNIARAKLMKKRIAQIRRERAAGRSYRQIVETETSPLLVQLITASRRALDEPGARIRRTEALALHDEGMTMEQIAAKFGVTRQRVSGLLRDARSDPA